MNLTEIIEVRAAKGSKAKLKKEAKKRKMKVSDYLRAKLGVNNTDDDKHLFI